MMAVVRVCILVDSDPKTVSFQGGIPATRPAGSAARAY
jgi:hypothetical protein